MPAPGLPPGDSRWVLGTPVNRDRGGQSATLSGTQEESDDCCPRGSQRDRWRRLGPGSQGRDAALVGSAGPLGAGVDLPLDRVSRRPGSDRPLHQGDRSVGRVPATQRSRPSGTSSCGSWRSGWPATRCGASVRPLWGQPGRAARLGLASSRSFGGVSTGSSQSAPARSPWATGPPARPNGSRA